MNWKKAETPEYLRLYFFKAQLKENGEVPASNLNFNHRMLSGRLALLDMSLAQLRHSMFTFYIFCTQIIVSMELFRPTIRGKLLILLT